MTAPGIDGLDPLPRRIDRLGEVALDLWWSWNPDARELFRQLDYELWRSTAHNPVLMLRHLSSTRLKEAAQDPVFLDFYDRTLKRLDPARRGTDTWWKATMPALPGRSIAYFSAEFALHQSLPIYAGGLGVLAGDICKESSARCRVHVSTGLLPSACVNDWKARGGLRAFEMDRRAHHAGNHSRRTAVCHIRSTRKSDREGVGLARAGRPHQALPPRYQS